MAKVLMVEHSLVPGGGSNAVNAWIIHALADRHQVELLTWRPVDLEKLNAFYGIALSRTFTMRRLPAWLCTLIDVCPLPLHLLKMSLVLREAKRIAGNFDLVICGGNEAGLGDRSIQYVHYPSRLRPRPKVDLRWYHYRTLLTLYYEACDRLASIEPGGARRALTLANSRWTAGLVKQLYGEQSRVMVVYPPVTADVTGRPWEDRDDGFVTIGRISPEKELERVIAIVSAVRRSVPTAHLHIIGSRGSASYDRRIDSLAREHGEWLHIHRDATREQLLGLLGSHRYYLHGMREEHFGIAPAEALAAGCVVFVPDGGGQVEIVGDEPRLRYSSEEDAVAKVVRTMTSPAEQDELRRHLEPRRNRFSTDRFLGEIRQAVDDVLANPS